MPNDKALGTNETGKHSGWTPAMRSLWQGMLREARADAQSSAPDNTVFYQMTLQLEKDLQASRRRTLEEVIAKLRTNVAADWLANGWPEIARGMTMFADELESELKAGEDRQ